MWLPRRRLALELGRVTLADIIVLRVLQFQLGGGREMRFSLSFAVVGAVGLSGCMATSALDFQGAYPLEGVSSASVQPVASVIETARRRDEISAGDPYCLASPTKLSEGSLPLLDNSIEVISVTTRGSNPTERAAVETVSKHGLRFRNMSLSSKIEDTDFRLSDIKTVNGDVLLFVHGYNNSRSAALERLGQMSLRLRQFGLEPTGIAFTWPSAGRTGEYLQDLQASNYSRDALANLFLSLAQNSEVKRVFVAAHSMGAWLTMESLRQVALSGSAGAVIDKLAKLDLIHADLDMDVFAKQLQKIRDTNVTFFGPGADLTEKTMIFANPDDEALDISSWLSSDSRLGNAECNDIRALNAAGPYRLKFVSTKGFTLTRSLFGDLANRFTRHWPGFDIRFTQIIASQMGVDTPPSRVASR